MALIALSELLTVSFADSTELNVQFHKWILPVTSVCVTSHLKQLYLIADYIFGGSPTSFELTPCWTERLYLIADNSKIKVILNISKQDFIMWQAVSTFSTMNLAYTITSNTLFKHCISPIEQQSFYTLCNGSCNQYEQITTHFITLLSLCSHPSSHIDIMNTEQFHSSLNIQFPHGSFMQKKKVTNKMFF